MNHELILLDIETQGDFFLPGGTCYTPAAEGPRRNVEKLFSWASRNNHPVLSTLLRVGRGQIGPLAAVPHCIEGTPGERKIPRTVIRPYVNLGLRNSTDLADDLFDRYSQVIIETRNTDLFEHARAERMITELPNVNFVICGAGVAGGIVEAAVGLRARGFGVILASDAVLSLGNPKVEMAFRRMLAKGVVFAKTAEIVTPAPKKRGATRFRAPSKAEAR